MSSSNGHKKRKYSDREKAAALAAIVAYGDLKSASEAMNIPERTLYDWANTERGIPTNTEDFAQVCQLEQKSLADKMEQVAHLYAARAAESDAVEKTSGWYAVQAVQKSAETFRLLREQSTQIVDSKVQIEAAIAHMRQNPELRDRDQAELESAVKAAFSLHPEFRDLGKVG